MELAAEAKAARKEATDYSRMIEATKKGKRTTQHNRLEAKPNSDSITPFQVQTSQEMAPPVNSNPKKRCESVKAPDPETLAAASKTLTKRIERVNIPKDPAPSTTAAKSLRMKSTSRTTTRRKTSTKCSRKSKVRLT